MITYTMIVDSNINSVGGNASMYASSQSGGAKKEKLHENLVQKNQNQEITKQSEINVHVCFVRKKHAKEVSFVFYKLVYK